MLTTFSILTGHSHIAMTTFAHDGQPVTRPVQFAQDGNKLYVMSLATAAEVRQIHENAQVEVAPCTQTGQPLASSIEAMALVLSGDQAAVAQRALNHKYGLPNRLHEIQLNLQGKQRVYLEITPM